MQPSFFSNALIMSYNVIAAVSAAIAITSTKRVKNPVAPNPQNKLLSFPK